MKNAVAEQSSTNVSRYHDGTVATVGDTVVCVNDSASFRRLAVGSIYNVEAAYDGSPVVIAGGAYHSTDRFAPQGITVEVPK
jgi:hypothetical protein